VLDDTSIDIDCPRCRCKLSAAFSRVMIGAGVFCPACQVHISFIDDRAGTKTAHRLLSQFMHQFPKTIEINFDL
jgi:UDP-N-acetylmuramyl pentapeptide phosphotransferase/UDP-N-acetylglucosamine-1-phosphate transferase